MREIRWVAGLLTAALAELAAACSPDAAGQRALQPSDGEVHQDSPAAIPTANNSVDPTRACGTVSDCILRHYAPPGAAATECACPVCAPTDGSVPAINKDTLSVYVKAWSERCGAWASRQNPPCLPWPCNPPANLACDEGECTLR